MSRGEKIKLYCAILDWFIILTGTFIILFCVGRTFYSRIDRRIEHVKIDKKMLVQGMINKEAIIVDQSDFENVKLYKNVDDILIDKHNEKNVFMALKTGNKCDVEVVGKHTFWFHTLPNITRVISCTKGDQIKE